MESSSSSFCGGDEQIDIAFDGIAPSTTSEIYTIFASYQLYHVFINHRGPDVKNTLARSIYQSLQHRGLQVFLDSQELHYGDDLPTKIQEAMHTASIHIAIFSETYAQSPWCLAELSYMLKTRVKIIPVFYGVQPCDLRWVESGRGVYADAFTQHELKGRYESHRLAEWKAALHLISFRYGFYLNNLNSDLETFLNSLVEAVLEEVKKVPLEVAKHPVGLYNTVQDFEDFIRSERQMTEKVLIVGIVGMGGSGKTTLAKEIFNLKLSSFSRSCFLFDVRETSAKRELETLQSKLLKDLAYTDMKISSTNEGMQKLRERLSSLRVLIVLDDIDHWHQLDALLVRDVLDSGSMIIVTSRDKSVLLRSQIPLIYEMKRMETVHAEELFCRHAFLQPCPLLGFELLVLKFLIVCDGLPLSLKVVGGHLCGNYDKDYWQCQLEKISETLPKDIKKTLKLSYNALEREEKQLFLDIACFFLGEEKNLVVRIWDGWRGLCSLQTLEFKCLVELDEKNCIKMHDHLRDLGRDIANKQSASRLWSEDIARKFVNEIETGSAEVRGIMAATINHSYRNSLELECTSYYQPPFEELQPLTEGMKSPRRSSLGLKFLVIKGNCFNDKYRKLSRDLLWLRWYDCPYASLPSWLSMENLRVLELFGIATQTREMWHTDAQPPLQLRELNLSWTKNLPKSMESLKYLEKIELLSYLGQSLPDEICGLQRLKHLELRYCTKLTTLPIRFGDLNNLQHLAITCCDQLWMLPESFRQLTQLRFLNLSGCKKLVIHPKMLGDITTLEYLNFKNCEKLRMLPTHVTEQRSLRSLFLDGTSLEELPNDLGKLTHLEVLEIGSHFLKCLPESLGALNLLTSLKIVVSKIKYLPIGFGELTKLQVLSIYDTPLKEIVFTNANARNRYVNVRRDHPRVGKGRSTFSPLFSHDHLSRAAFGSAPGQAREINHHTRLWSSVDSSIFGCMRGLKSITIRWTHISKISICQSYFPNLETFILRDNIYLKEVVVLRMTLTVLNMANCRMLTCIQINPWTKLQYLDISWCSELEKLPNLESLSSLERFEARGCGKLKSIEGLTMYHLLERVEVDGCWELQNIDGLEHLQRLTNFKLSANNDTIWNCIQRLQRLPCKMILSGRAVSGVESIFDSLRFPELTLVDCMIAKIDNRGEHYWALEIPLTRVHSTSAVFICFVVNNLKQQNFYVQLSPLTSDYLCDVIMEKGTWVYISVFTQDSLFMRKLREKHHKEVMVIKNKHREYEVKKGWMAMVSEGQEGKILEVLDKLLTTIVR